MPSPSPQYLQQGSSRWDIDFDSFYDGDHTYTVFTPSISPGCVYQPQPVRPVGSLLWGTDRHALARPDDSHTYHDEDSYAATYFPDKKNTLGLFSTDPNYSAAAGSPRRHLPPTPQPRLEVQDYEIEGGWSLDATGRTHYVPHGEIKEVDEEDLDILAEDSCTFLDEPLPPETTPPPRPKQRPIELISLPLLDRLPLGDVEPNTRIGPPPPSFHDFSGSFEFNDDSTISTTCSSPTTLTQSQELNIVEKIVASIMIASLDVFSLHAGFGALPKPNAADRALCDRVGKAIQAVQTSLSRHQGIPPEQWGLRSVSCQRKYHHRLLSLQRTLRRLHILSAVSPRINQVNRLRQFLEDYDAKLTDLAVKFNAMFDRLRDRQWNTVLVGMCADLQRRLDARKQERKTARAVRSGHYDHSFRRRPSMVEVS
ncbi:hypothetical protein B0H19DRAFT_13894 [Mycena capillaripes]|nr:hypothetical protein B0H19DRAFT_13894 [Mycena capillaripes]